MKQTKSWTMVFPDGSVVLLEPMIEEDGWICSYARHFHTEDDAIKYAAKLFGEWLAETRRQAGESQESLAGKLGTRMMTVSRWERGVQLPNPKAMQTIRRWYEQVHGGTQD